MTDAAPHDPEGIHNFRELSGYPTAGGVFAGAKVYRAGALELMTEDDSVFLADELGIRTVLDLRHPDELAMGAASAHALAERVVAISIFREDVPQEAVIAELNGLYGTGPSPRRYLHYLEMGGDRLAQAFALFADEANYPFLVHCTAGKDRTGVLLGMLMDVLGCSDADIASEYALSDASIDRLIAYLRNSGRTLEGTDDEIRARLATPPERMAGFIDLVREHHGSSEAFFASQGVSAETIARIRALLTA